MEKVTSFDKPQDVVVVNKLLGSLDKNKANISYGEAAPGDMNLGQLYVMDDGVTRRVYLKTAKGYLGYITIT